MLSNYNKKKLSFSLFALFFFFSQACKKEHALPEEDFPSQLSATNIFSGTLSNLVPSTNYVVYEIASELFSDHAEKQRLIKLPAGTKITKTNGVFPDFPEGTSIIKTFYYWNDKRDLSKGKKILETRVLLLKNGEWLFGTYRWNQEQTEGYLLTSGSNEAVNWIDDEGTPNTTTYRIPNMTECVSCHEHNDLFKPVGPKWHNLSKTINNGGVSINQLAHFQTIGLVNNFNINDIEAIPNYKENSLSNEQRSRAYLDANCGHCHSPFGSSKKLDLDLRYHTPIENTGIIATKSKMIDQLESGQMPLLGTSTLDQTYVQLITQYINSL